MSNLRDAIAREVLIGDEDRCDPVDVADAILALPEMQARERVIQAARVWRAAHYENSEGPALKLAAHSLYAAVTELDALEAT